MTGIQWVKLSTQMFSDEKINAIRSMPSGNDMCLIWIQLITLAGRVNDNGQIYLTEDIPYNDTVLADSLKYPVETVRLALATFQKMKMIAILSNDRIALLNWDRHQNIEGLDRVREQARLRTQRYRQKLLSCDATVTSRDAPELEVEKEVEKIDSRAGARPIASSENVAKVVSYLNEKTGRSYNAGTKATTRLVLARIRDGHHFIDFQRVIDNRVQVWGGDPKMAEDLRPETLFGTKFDSYLATAGAPKMVADISIQWTCMSCGKVNRSTSGTCAHCRQPREE